MGIPHTHTQPPWAYVSITATPREHCKECLQCASATTSHESLQQQQQQRKEVGGKNHNQRKQQPKNQTTKQRTNNQRKITELGKGGLWVKILVHRNVSMNPKVTFLCLTDDTVRELTTHSSWVTDYSPKLQATLVKRVELTRLQASVSPKWSFWPPSPTEQKSQE